MSDHEIWNLAKFEIILVKGISFFGLTFVSGY